MIKLKNEGDNFIFIQNQALNNAELTNLSYGEDVMVYYDVLSEQTEFEKLRQECRELVKQHKNNEIDDLEFLDSLQSVYDRLESMKYKIKNCVADNDETKQILKKLKENCDNLCDLLQNTLDTAYHKK